MDWPEWPTLLKSPIWINDSCAALRSRLQNPSGEAAIKPSPSIATTGDVVRVEIEFGNWKKLMVAGHTIGYVVAARGT